MEIDEEMRRKIVLSVVAVLLFLGALVAIGVTFSDGGITPTGGYALVGVIGFFVLLMGGIGFYLARAG